MHPSTNKRGKKQVGKRPPTPEINDNCIQGDLDHQVSKFPDTRGFGLQEKGPKGIEEELQQDPNRFCDDISHSMGFGLAWDVHVNAIDSLEEMVLKVVLLEGDGHGGSNREVGEDAKPAVVRWIGEGKIVAELVDSKEEIVVEEGAKKICNY